jgi:glycosyltransferase involved in cell wall biosynthesis
VWIPSNFSNTTGYAWKFFFRLFNVVARGLRPHGITPVLSFATIDGPVEILDPDLPFEAFEFDPRRITLGSLRRLRMHVHRGRIRYAYLTDWPSWHWVYGLLRLWGIRRILAHSHVSVPEPYDPPPTRGWRRLVKVMLRRSPLAADEVIACSHFVRRRLEVQGCYPARRITVITHGIDIDRFRCDPPDGGGDGVARVFCVARSVRYKGVHVLIEATRLLCDRGLRGRFVVNYAGDGPELAAFERMVEAGGIADTFRFIGRVDDTRDHTCAADVVVVPSIWGDAYPLTVLEAMAAGRALVTTDVGGIPEQVGGTEAALVLPPGDAAALADALERLIMDSGLRARMGQAGRQRAEAAFREEPFHRAVYAHVERAFGLADSAAGV